MWCSSVVPVLHCLDTHVNFRSPFLRRLDLSNPLQGTSISMQGAIQIFAALVNSLCPLEELDMKGHW